MATKKKARKKKAAVRAYPTTRILSVDKLTQIGACFSARLKFVQTFLTFGNVTIGRNTVKRLTDSQVAALGKPPAHFILDSVGSAQFRRARLNAGVDDWNTTDVNDVRTYLRLLANAYIRHPRTQWT